MPIYFPSRLDTIDGTATAGEDYEKLSEEFKMERGEQEKKITIRVIDDNQWEPDETFFVKISLPEGEETRAKIGSKTVALVTIINDDGKSCRRRRVICLHLHLCLEPGVIEFAETINLVKESVGKAEIKVVRVNGADGRVTVHYKTKDIDAIGTRDYESQYHSASNDLEIPDSFPSLRQGISLRTWRSLENHRDSHQGRSRSRERRKLCG